MPPRVSERSGKENAIMAGSHLRCSVLAGFLALSLPGIAFASSASDWHDLAPIAVGDGGEVVAIFTAPSCPVCRKLMDQLPALAERYRILILPISFTAYDAQRVRMLACAVDQEAAARTLLLHQDIRLPQREPCDLSAIQTRYEKAQELGVASVPFIVRPDGKISRGLRPDLTAWLARGARR
jgi:thiol:disulfide interchange protein DsbC